MPRPGVSSHDYRPPFSQTLVAQRKSVRSRKENSMNRLPYSLHVLVFLLLVIPAVAQTSKEDPPAQQATLGAMEAEIKQLRNERERLAALLSALDKRIEVLRAEAVRIHFEQDSKNGVRLIIASDTPSPATLRASTALGAKTLAIIPPGSTLIGTGIESYYWLVDYDGLHGYVPDPWVVQTPEVLQYKRSSRDLANQKTTNQEPQHLYHSNNSSGRGTTTSTRKPSSSRCCRVCRAGKACGNSCISRNKTCRSPPGCACNG